MSIVLTRATKQAARYTDAGGRERCSGCRFFMPQGTCGRIIGPVSPRGWCRFFSQEAVQRWQPQGAIGFGTGPSLALDFMNPGYLDPHISFTRNSNATYFDSVGTMQTAFTNVMRWDYDPVTHALRGLLLEDARTNLVLNSGNAANASWGPAGITVAAPTVTANQALAPDGTTTAARVVYPAVSVAGNASYLMPAQGAMTVAPYSYSVWLRGNAGGEQVYLSTTPDGATYFRQLATLTTAWQRFTLVTGNLSTAGWFFLLGTDRRDASQAATGAQTVFIWGGQVELGGFPTSYIPTTAATVTRAIDVCGISAANMAGWFVPPGGTWFAEFIAFIGLNTRIIGAPVPGGMAPLYLGPSARTGQFDGSVSMLCVNSTTLGVVSKSASNYAPGTGKVCSNGGAVASIAMTVGYSGLTSAGIFTTGGAGSVDNTSGYIRNVRYWPRVLSDAELQTVTT